MINILAKIHPKYETFTFKPVYVFYSLPSASGLAFRHELKIKRAQRRMSDDRCLENIEITDLILPLRALWLSQKTALSFKIYLLLLRVTKSNVKESLGQQVERSIFMKESTLFLNVQRLKSFESSEMSIASILPGRISTSVKGGRRLWREQGITQYSSQLCWLIECLNTCGHLGLKKRTEIDRPSRLYTGTQDTTKVTSRLHIRIGYCDPKFTK
ncbi:uncharacterized protein EV154DRAFT_489121 [Mucor mucedo]|uniref:uncharacterized protein n=1 Tax=Mucor mucedo TaxID=29922 RepID=UPI00221EE5E1|nr:uncharacterized protein EV154DRAFT_489121 [Mucor mucedo]KAI7863099.1 hypothetical protein EV154DRAFT_489121 [Mucor mucedo]